MKQSVLFLALWLALASLFLGMNIMGLFSNIANHNSPWIGIVGVVTGVIAAGVPAFRLWKRFE